MKRILVAVLAVPFWMGLMALLGAPQIVNMSGTTTNVGPPPFICAYLPFLCGPSTFGILHPGR